MPRMLSLAAVVAALSVAAPAFADAGGPYKLDAKGNCHDAKDAFVKADEPVAAGGIPLPPDRAAACGTAHYSARAITSAELPIRLWQQRFRPSHNDGNAPAQTRRRLIAGMEGSLEHAQGAVREMSARRIVVYLDRSGFRGSFPDDESSSRAQAKLIALLWLRLELRR